MPNSHTKSTWVCDGIYAAGTSSYVTGGATVIPKGNIHAAASVKGSAGVFTTLRATTLTNTNYSFVGGQSYKIAAGTIVTTGGATAPITSTGLTTIHKVFMQRLSTTYATATTNGNYSPRPCRAHGTVGSFYPIIFRSSGPNGAPTLGLSAGATHSWLAIGT